MHAVWRKAYSGSVITWERMNNGRVRVLEGM